MTTKLDSKVTMSVLRRARLCRCYRSWQRELAALCAKHCGALVVEEDGVLFLVGAGTKTATRELYWSLRTEMRSVGRELPTSIRYAYYAQCLGLIAEQVTNRHLPTLTKSYKQNHEVLAA